MGIELSPEILLRRIEKKELSPVYLFYGPGEFRLEKVLDRLRETLVPDESLRDFNLNFFYAGKGNPGGAARPADVVEMARSIPFMSEKRLVVVRGAEAFPAASLEGFTAYLDDPVPSTCLVFVSAKPDFRKKFFRRLRDSDAAVNFRQLNENQVVPWIKKMAKELAVEVDDAACAYLQQIIGNRLRDLYAELEKLSLRHGKNPVGIHEVKELAIHSRTYTVFELMDQISFRRGAESIVLLNRLLDEEGREGALKLLGMLNRQIGLLWGTLDVIKAGGRAAQISRRLGLRDFQVRPLIQQAKHWKERDLEDAYRLLRRADGLLKSSSPGGLVLENLVLSLCF